MNQKIKNIHKQTFILNWKCDHNFDSLYYVVDISDRHNQKHLLLDLEIISSSENHVAASKQPSNCEFDQSLQGHVKGFAKKKTASLYSPSFLPTFGKTWLLEMCMWVLLYHRRKGRRKRVRYVQRKCSWTRFLARLYMKKVVKFLSSGYSY